MKPKLLLLLIFSILIPLSAFSQEEKSVIKIESAQNTEYKKDKAAGTEEIVLNGNVVISVSKGSSNTKISADRVTFNRASDMLYASGNVVLEQTGSSAGGQTITAESLLFNTSTLEGIFDDGRAVQTQSDAINLPSGSKLIVHSNIFGRSSSNTIAFKNAELTFCDDEDPHWKIWASRIWLLPGGEFAFFNAVLFVGHVPLLYLPAFYYPKDELVFNPSFGYDDRKGYFFQTTTYLSGRKPLDTSSSGSDDDDITKGLFNFMKASSLKEQVREGLVLHNLDADYKGSTSDYVKLMADYYTNLGFYAGIEGIWKPSGVISSLDGSLALGFSNTVFPSRGVYTDYHDDKTWSDKSNFLGMELPFRYGGKLNVSFAKPFSLSVSLPFYSDPYFADDFGDRSEYIDWLGFIMGGDEDEESSSSSVSSFTWQVSGSYSFTVPQFLKPYISTVSLSSFASSIAFSSRNRSSNSSEDEGWASADPEWKSATPERAFFYPSKITPFKISGTISGTLISYPESVEKKSVTTPSFPAKLDVPDEFLTEEEKKKKAEAFAKKEEQPAESKAGVKDESAEKKEDAGSASSSETEDKTWLSESDLPSLSPAVSTAASSFNGLEYKLTYSVAPQYASEITYDSSSLYKPEDFKWTDIYSSYYQVKAPVNLTSKLSYRSSFASMSNTLSFNPVYQEHPNLDGYTESQTANVKKSDYSARKLDLSNTNYVSFKPFIYSPTWKNSSIDWNTSIKVIQTEFTGDVADPRWEYNVAKLWDSDDVTTHTLSATIAATENDYSQSLTLSTKLPPQTDYYHGTLKFTFPIASLSFSTGIQQKSKDDTSFEKLPFQQSAKLNLFSNKLTFTQSFNYKLEEDYADSFRVTASYSGFQLSYNMSYSYGYDFTDAGWQQKSEKEFQPFNLSLTYSNSGTAYYFWKNRISFTPSVSTNVVYDCIRPTNSYFRFAPSFTFKINDFLDITFSSETTNSVIFRYFQSWTSYGDVIPGETNPFVDLFNSVKFWGNGYFYDPEQTARKSSGFKVKNFKITVSHSLHDWDLKATLSFKPRTVSENGKSFYDYHPYFSLGVTWRPLASMRTEIVDEYGEWELNP